MTYWKTPCDEVTLLHGNSLDVMESLPAMSCSIIFADPPYFLSGDGTTCSGGERVAVSKGSWDVPRDIREMHAFNGRWLRLCRRLLKPGGTIWVCGTHHAGSIHSIGVAMAQLQLEILNEVVWRKPNPPPSLACRSLTHAHETLLWARKRGAKHHFNYKTAKAYAGKQMLDVWDAIGPPNKAERRHGRHPTQKPTALVSRCLAISSPHRGVVLDPFNGSGTTGVVCVGLAGSRLKYIGIDMNEEYLEITKQRILSEAPELSDACS